MQVLEELKILNPKNMAEAQAYVMEKYLKNIAIKKEETFKRQLEISKALTNIGLNNPPQYFRGIKY